MKGVEAPSYLSLLRYPLLASEKIDGIRALIVTPQWARDKLRFQAKHKEYLSAARHAITISASGKPIPNHYIQSKLDLPQLVGLDGELIASSRFNETSSAIMSHEGEPVFQYHVFDCFDHPNNPYEHRFLSICSRYFPSNLPISILPQTPIAKSVELEAYVDKLLEEDAEGAIVRDPKAPYKYGRATAKQGWLFKIKPFADIEVTVVGYEELLRNENEAEINELGYTKRSSHKDGKISSGLLGNLICKCAAFPVEFGVGTGFTEEERRIMWAARATLPGRLAKIKYLAKGSLAAPRNPVFLGFRSADDMTN